MAGGESAPWRSWLAAAAGVQLTLVPAWLAGDPALLSLDGLLLWALARGARRRWVAAAGAAALAWEAARALGSRLMHQDPLLFDLVHLSRHLAVLGVDLLGALAPAVAAAVALAVAAVVAAQTTLLGRARAVPAPAPGLLAAFAFLAWALGAPVRFGLGALPANLAASWTVAAQVDATFAAARAAPLPPVAWRGQPDVEVVVIESYGRVLFDRPKLAEAWAADAAPLADAAARHGYVAVSAFVRSTVSGGRSWLADAALLTGLPIAHEAEYQRVLAEAPQLPHAVRVLGGAGWDTWIVRPKNRPRPGVVWANELDADRTIGFPDLGYTGAERGWGWVPDQYTLGWLRANVLRPEGPPRFVFTHLVSAHAPWHDVPDLADDWRALNTGEGRFDEPRGAAEELWLQLSRYQRRDGHRGRRRAAADHLSRYAAAVGYDLAALAEHVAALPDRRRVLVILGDHPPPLVTSADSFDVPVHVLVRDPADAAPFRARGFRDGFTPAGPAVTDLPGLTATLWGG